MAISDLPPKVLLPSGQWIRSTVRRYPKGLCPSCGYQGALRRNKDVEPDQVGGWVTRRHDNPMVGKECGSFGVIAEPVNEVDPGWFQ